MKTLLSAIQWFTTTNGRAAAAVVIFLLLWVAKNLPVVSAWLAADRRKILANVVLSLGPAAVVLLDHSKPAAEAWMAAAQIALGAAGLQGLLSGLLGEQAAAKLGLSSKALPAAATAPADTKPAAEAEPEKPA